MASTLVAAHINALALTEIVNDPKRAGQLASQKVRFGALGTLSVAAVHTRLDAIQWFVWDAEQIDEVTGESAVVRQADSLTEAVDGLL